MQAKFNKFTFVHSLLMNSLQFDGTRDKIF